MPDILKTRLVQQVAALSPRLKLWLGWLILTTFVVPLFLLDTAFYAAAMVCQAFNLIFGAWLMARHGLVWLLGLSHILFWTPMLAKFWWFYDSLSDPFLLVFGWIMIITVVISLFFDVRDYRDWLRGQRGPIGAS